MSIGTTAGFLPRVVQLARVSKIAILLLFFQLCGWLRKFDRGGIKVIRLLLLVKQGCGRSRLVHPERPHPGAGGDQNVDSRAVEAVWGFFAVSSPASPSCTRPWRPQAGPDDRVQRRGRQYQQPGSGPRRVGAHYAEMRTPASGSCVFAMLGRWEISSPAILLTPAFWRK